MENLSSFRDALVATGIFFDHAKIEQRSRDNKEQRAEKKKAFGRLSYQPQFQARFSS